MNIYCRICGTPGGACGDSHQTLPLFTGAAISKGDRPMAEPQPLAEYTYWVGQVPTTGMLTPDLATRLNAVPVGEVLDDADPTANNEAERLSSRIKDVPDGVVDPEDSLPKARTARNKRSQ